MILVIDANCLTQIIPSISKYHWIWNYFFTGKYRLAVTTDILNEYDEVLSNWIPKNIVDNIIKSIVESPYSITVSPSYFWKLIDKDKNDKKYVDCAVAANADYVISNDRHFKVLENTKFPKIICLKVYQVKKLMF